MIDNNKKKDLDNKKQKEEIKKEEPKIEDKKEEDIINNQEVDEQQPSFAFDYLSKLLEKHSQKANLVHSFTSNKNRYFQDQILNGKYDIKHKHWSAQQQKQKQLKISNIKSNSKIFQSRKHLLQQLQQLQHQINQNQDQKVSKQVTQEQRIAFMKKIQKQRKQFLKKKQQLLKKAQEQRLQQQKRIAQQTQKIENQKKMKKKQEIQEKMKIQQQSRKKKQQQFKSQQLLLKEKMKQKTMVQKMEEQYNIKQNQSLQQRKKHLAEIRALHKPIDRKEFDAHAQKIQQFHAQRLAAIAASTQNIQEKTTAVFYKSAFYKKIQQQPKIFLDKRNQEEKGKLKQVRDKLKKFSQQIRQNYKPVIDQKKKQQLLLLRNSSRQNRSMSTNIQRAKDPQQGKKLGLRYLQFSKMQIDQKLLGSNDNKTQQQSQDDKNKKLDYLSQLRQKNKNRKPQTAQNFIAKMQKLNISKQQKMKKIIEFTDNIERKAKMKELNDLNSYGLVDSQLDRLYLEAIQAKLGLLQNY